MKSKLNAEFSEVKALNILAITLSSLGCPALNAVASLSNVNESVPGGFIFLCKYKESDAVLIFNTQLDHVILFIGPLEGLADKI